MATQAEIDAQIRAVADAGQGRTAAPRAPQNELQIKAQAISDAEHGRTPAPQALRNPLQAKAQAVADAQGSAVPRPPVGTGKKLRGTNPQPGDDKPALILGGKLFDTWQQYHLDADFLRGASNWQLRMGLPEQVFPPEAVRGAPVSVMLGGDIIMTGRVDNVTRDVSRQGLTLTLGGRDAVAVLVDCAVPIYSARQLSLEEAIEAIVRPLGVSRIRIQAQGMPRRDMIHVEPGERAWDTLHKLCACRGLWPWCDPDGTLVIGGPDYSAPPVDILTLRQPPYEGGNSLMRLTDIRSLHSCYSQLTVLAQSHALQADSHSKTATVDLSQPLAEGSVSMGGTDGDSSGEGETGHYSRAHTEHDPTVTSYRPQVMVAGDVDNAEQLQFRAKKLMSDARLSGLTLIAEVSGHRTADGELWKPGQRVHVVSEPHGIDEVFFLMGRTFSGGSGTGPVTLLRLKEDGIWIPDKKAGKQKKHAKKQKLAVVDVWSNRK